MYLQQAEKNASLSRQIANTAFRDCIVPPPSQVDIVACLDNVRNSYEEFVQTTSPDATVVMSVYRYDEVTEVVFLDAEHRAVIGSGSYTSHYPEGGDIGYPFLLSDFQSTYVSGIQETNPRVVIVEVFEEYERFISHFTGFLRDDTIYQASIF